MKKYLAILLPPLVLGLFLSFIACVSNESQLMQPAISSVLPVDTELDGWYGIKRQESERERGLLSPDTRFSKAIYQHINPFTYSKEEPAVNVSIVFSGNDLNNSIHRPERCLPSQGHLDLRGSDAELPLADGTTLAFRRIDSRTPVNNTRGRNLYHIHYYVFIGHYTVHDSHVGRTLQDVYDRFVYGMVQSWAYLQVGTYWGEEVGITQQQADAHLKSLIRDLVPRILKRDMLKN